MGGRGYGGGGPRRGGGRYYDDSDRRRRFGENVVKVRGLPYSAGARDLQSFFQEYHVRNLGLLENV